MTRFPATMALSEVRRQEDRLPMKYSSQALLLLVCLLLGCSHRPTRMTVEDLKKAAEDVDKHAKEIEKAGEPIVPNNRP